MMARYNGSVNSFYTHNIHLWSLHSNIFYHHQIHLLGKSSEKEDIPSYEDIFGNDDDEVHY